MKIMQKKKLMNINLVRVQLDQKNNSQKIIQIKFIDHFQGYIQEQVASWKQAQR